MKGLIFLSAKFKGTENEAHLTQLENILKELGYQAYLPIRELDDFGRKDIASLGNPKEVMGLVKEKIQQTDYILVDWQEKGVGVGIEAGAAWALKIPVIVIYPHDSEVSMTMTGIAEKVIQYSDYTELKQKLAEYFR